MRSEAGDAPAGGQRLGSTATVFGGEAKKGKEKKLIELSEGGKGMDERGEAMRRARSTVERAFYI